MGDRFCKDLETALSLYSKQNIDIFYDDEETEEDYEDDDVNDDVSDDRADELACPFCFEDFDVLGLCCHIDSEHRMDVKHGICPVCFTKVGINMVSHVITQHENILKTLCNKKHRNAHSRSAVSTLRRELQEKHLHCLEESSVVGSSSDVAADSMLLSFVHNAQSANNPKSIRATSSTEASLSEKSSDDTSLERYANHG
ncbi:protein DEHYDRATION-INDUCED 19 homolog 4-like [Olea europaea var. sylvestris]|uniref:protein DEHYDRATION-INDUCED 19 homolog 4-like n=1 Tax=Olea europaea var. sylvestris TaxID=158386 RepID=UPI000C1CD3C2|nr:protein DEHYDRATION-INDUCED 19 homolog 4-like [Olea europaea var. sylvestris]